jgi:BTB/POZ domain
MNNEAAESTKEKSVGCCISPTDASTSRLRFSDPDLQIVVGEGEEQKTYEYYSPIMATHSSYIDHALAAPMREQESRSLTFPEIHPPDWDKMMSYLHAGAPAPQSVDDVRVVLNWYDKYDFDSGLEICDRVLGGIDFNAESNLDHAMAAVELVYQHSHRMTSSLPKAKKFISDMLGSDVDAFRFFEIKHIRQLIPALRTEPDLWEKMQNFHRFPVDGDADRETYLDCLLFPDLLMRCIQAQLAEKDIVSEPELRVVVTHSTSVAGWYHLEGGAWKKVDTDNMGCHLIQYDALSGWAISHRVNTSVTSNVLFVCYTNLANVFLPPKHGWKPLTETDPPQAAPVLEFRS